VTELQRRLAQRGYYSGAIDGIMGGLRRDEQFARTSATTGTEFVGSAGRQPGVQQIDGFQDASSHASTEPTNSRPRVRACASAEA
jgi:hypothetical protein